MTTSEPDTAPTPRPLVVVGVDGSEQSVAALRWADYLARVSGADTLVVAVWQTNTGFGFAGEGWGVLPQDWDPRAIVQGEVQQVLADVFGEVLPPGLELRIEQGNVAQVLLELSTGAQALVVGSRGHGGFASLLLGSVSAACAGHATCPVLVVHGDSPPPAHAAGQSHPSR